jgi:hypothetical protein
MKIELQEIPIQNIVQYAKHKEECQGYVDKGEDGVYGIGGRLNIRPAYQREFIYKDKQRDAVIHTIRNGFPLNVLYWVINKDGSYEVLDGQQRLISVGQYVNGDFSVEDMYFHNLREDEQDQILNYKLMVYFCEGNDTEKLNWFKTINIAGEELSDQELRNAIYTGPWITDAKRYFSKIGCPAYQIATDYLKGKMNRQHYLETAIKWINNNNVEAYMADRQHKENAKELWEHFERAITWAQKLFPNYRKEMKGLPWGPLYSEFSDKKYNPDKLEVEVSKLMQDEDVTKKSGIYSYIFTGNEKELSIRAFADNMKREAYERQKGACIHCKEKFDLSGMEGDHITPWIKGGRTISDNCQMLCKPCNRVKGAK